MVGFILAALPSNGRLSASKTNHGPRETLHCSPINFAKSNISLPAWNRWARMHGLCISYKNICALAQNKVLYGTGNSEWARDAHRMVQSTITSHTYLMVLMTLP